MNGETEKVSILRKFLAGLIIITAVAVIAGSTFYVFFYKKIGEVVNEEYGFQIEYFEDWNVVEENYPERSGLSVQQIPNQVADCGIGCTVVSRTKISKEDTNFVINIFANSENDTLEDFIANLTLNDNLERLKEVVIGNSINALTEVFEYGDNRETTNYYFSKGEFMYHVNKNIPNSASPNNIIQSENIDLMIGSLVLE